MFYDHLQVNVNLNSFFLEILEIHVKLKKEMKIIVLC